MVLPAVEERASTGSSGKTSKRIGPLRAEDDEFTELVIVLGVGLEIDDPGAEAVGIEVVILDRLIAPDLVVEIGRLVRPAHVDAGRGRLDDLDPAVAQLFVHERLDTIDGPLRLRDDLGPFVARPGVMNAGPEGNIEEPRQKTNRPPLGNHTTTSCSSGFQPSR